MHIFTEVGPLRDYLKQAISPNTSVGFVPTMGALHEGHLHLFRRSVNENSLTVGSIFVNPTQFNNPEDLARYPRSLDHDLELLSNAGCDLVFCPTTPVMYPQESTLKFDFGSLDKILEGEFRPGHFNGVALIVSKLFNIVQPHRAYFGQKDFQQFKIISRLTEELRFNLTLVCVPIVREPDGLAMSSRNVRLSQAARKEAVILFESLQKTRLRVLNGESFALIRDEMSTQFIKKGIKLEYLALADRETLALMNQVTTPEAGILLIAAEVGGVRLIDNLFLRENHEY